MSKPPAIVVEDLRQGYGRRPVLQGVSLTVSAGQTFALLGRNGAGKTTLIRTLLGVLPPAAGSGRVEVLGLSPSERPIEVRGRVGYLAEDQTIYPWMTADEVAQFLAPFYPHWDAPLASSLLDRFGVPRGVKIRQLSKGHNIRLGLALALAHRPELVILDDPALGLDPISRKQFNRDVIEHLQGEGRTVFYSSHLLYEVEPLADVVAILDAGRIIRSAAVEDLQRDVKRVILSSVSLTHSPRPEKLLDVTRDGARWLITVDEAENWIASLRAGGCDLVVEDLSLDEIFEAFVIGRPDWPAASGAAKTASVH
jgi:ABC-2 type transport system ATP-binding protein